MYIKYSKIIQRIGQLILLFSLAACESTTTEPIASVQPVPGDIQVEHIEEENTIINKITQTKTFDQCDSAGPFNAEIKFSQSSNIQTQQELVLTGKVGVEAGISAVVKGTLEGEVKQHYASSLGSETGHEESVRIEVPAYTQQEFTLIWQETRREGTVSYIENNETKQAQYSYRVGLELNSTRVQDLPCPNRSNGDSSEMTPAVLPTYTPIPTSKTTNTQEQSTSTNQTPVSVNTPEGSILEVGEWWKSNNVWVRVSNFELKSGTSGKVAVFLELKNLTGNNLVFQWTRTGNLSLKDNTGHIYEPAAGWTSTTPNEVVVEAGATVQLKCHGSREAFTSYDTFFFNSSVKELILTVSDISRISLAEWKIDVPK